MNQEQVLTKELIYKRQRRVGLFGLAAIPLLIWFRYVEPPSMEIILSILYVMMAIMLVAPFVIYRYLKDGLTFSVKRYTLLFIAGVPLLFFMLIVTGVFDTDPLTPRSIRDALPIDYYLTIPMALSTLLFTGRLGGIILKLYRKADRNTQANLS